MDTVPQQAHKKRRIDSMGAFPVMSFASVHACFDARMSEYRAAVEQWAQEREARFQREQEALQRDRQQLDEDKRKLAVEQARFAKEKESVHKFTDMSEVIELNAGGGIISA